MKLSEYPDVVSLYDKNNLYKKLLFHIPDFVFHLKISPHNDYHFPFISKSAFSHFGLSMDEIQYDAVQVLLDKIEPSDSEEFFKSVEECRLNHQPWHHEFRVNIPQGQRWMRGIATVE